MEKQIYSADLLRKYFFNNRCIIFEVTNDCNLDCSYCTYGELYNTRGINKKSGINLNLAKVFINFMVDIWNSSQVSSFKTNIWVGFYGGEPLLAFEDIRSLVEFTKEKELLFNKVKFSMTTNGILLDKYIDFFVNNKFNILISLDGDEGNNAYRKLKNGDQSFRLLIKNLEFIKSKYPDYFRNHMNFNSVLHDLNSKKEINRFFNNKFQKSTRITSIDNSGVQSNKKEKFQKMFKSKNDEYNTIEFDRDFTVDYLLDNPFTANAVRYLHYRRKNFIKSSDQVLNSKSENSQFPTGSCIPLQNRVFFSHDGFLFPCERVGREHSMGKVTDKGVEIFFEEIVEKYNNYFKKLYHQCKTCANEQLCPLCVLKYDFKGNMDKCRYWKDKTNKRNLKINEVKDVLAENKKIFKITAEEIFFD